MRKRLFSLFLTFVLVLSMMPVLSMADGGALTADVNLSEATQDVVIDWDTVGGQWQCSTTGAAIGLGGKGFTADDPIVISGALQSGKNLDICVQNGNTTSQALYIVLDTVDIDVTGATDVKDGISIWGVYNTNISNVVLNLRGASSVKGNENGSGLFSEKNLSITGTGSLTATGGNNGGGGIYCVQDLTIGKGVNLTANQGLASNFAGVGMCCGGNLIIEAANSAAEGARVQINGVTAAYQYGTLVANNFEIGKYASVTVTSGTTTFSDSVPAAQINHLTVGEYVTLDIRGDNDGPTFGGTALKLNQDISSLYIPPNSNFTPTPGVGGLGEKGKAIVNGDGSNDKYYWVVKVYDKTSTLWRYRIVEDGAKVNVVDVTRGGMEPLGLYKNSELTQPFDIQNDTITDNTSLYGVWADLTGIVGDSIVTGYGLSQPSSNFANQVGEGLGIAGSDKFVNLGINGLTTTDAKNNWAQFSPLDRQGRFEKIVLSIGGNDVLQPFVKALGEAINDQNGTSIQYQTPEAVMQALTATLSNDTNGVKKAAIEQYVVAQLGSQTSSIINDYTQNMHYIIQRMLVNNPNAKIYILNQYNPFSGVKGYEHFASGLGALSSQMNGSLSAIASNYSGKVVVVDVGTPINQNALLLTNIGNMDIHPNQAGHGVIAEAVYKSMTGQDLPNYVAVQNAAVSINGVVTLVNQATAPTEAAVDNYIKAKIDEKIVNTGVTAQVGKLSYVAPVAGTASLVNGTDGTYVFIVTLVKDGQVTFTQPQSVVIKATPYTSGGGTGGGTGSTVASPPKANASDNLPYTTADAIKAGKNGDTKLVSLVPNPNPGFSDVSTTHWAYDSIREAAALGFAQGMPSGGFEPRSSLGVADTFTFLDRVLLANGIDTMKLPRSIVEKYIKDKDHWAFGSMASIGSKLSESTLKTISELGDKPLSRELLAQVLYEITNGKLNNVHSSIAFTDIQDSLYKEAIDYCVRVGLLSGISDSQMAPQKDVTRAELMVILVRLNKVLK